MSKTALLYHLQAINHFYGKKVEIKNFYEFRLKFMDFFDIEISAPILAIDDLDIIKFDYQRFFNFLYNSKFSIYITSNYSFKDFIKAIPVSEIDKQKILSRLAYSIYEIKTKDIDYRIKNK